MSTAPRVSILVPTYNVAGYLQRALDSALSQTMNDFELIVVDDSTDGTLEIALAAAERDRRVRVLHNPRRLGLAASRNRALAAAQGRWVALLDGDDAWLPERLDRLLAMAEATGAEMVSDDLFLVAPDGHAARSFLRSQPTGLAHLTEPCWLTAGQLLRYRLGYLKPIMRRAFLEQHAIAYNPALQIQEDLHFFLSALLAGARWLQVSAAYYLYFHRHGSAMTEWVDRYERSRLLEASEALLDAAAVQSDPALRLEVQRFLDGERVALGWGLLRRDLRQRKWQALLRRVITHRPRLPRLVAHGIRSAQARRARHPADLWLLNPAPPSLGTEAGPSPFRSARAV